MALVPWLSFAGEPQQPVAPSSTKRSYVASRFGLELDGQFAGWVDSVQGGQAISDVVTGPSSVQKKHIANVKYEDITLNCGIAVSKDFYDWIKASLGGKIMRRNGAVVTCDYDFKVKSRLEWSNAAITEIGFPACDAASKDPAKMTIKFTPEMTRFTVSNPSTIYPHNNSGLQEQKKWLPSNFRLEIAGIDCSRVNKIEAITAKTVYPGNPARGVVALANAQAQLPVSNITLAVPEPYAESFYKWHQAFVIEGKNGTQGEKTGKLEYLTPDLKSSLFALTFQRLGILKFTPAVIGTGPMAIRQVQVELSCGNIGFDYGAAAALG
jgi:phage tail-like protein